MREHPLLFKGAMVQALLDQRKAQTRRVVTWHNSTLDGARVGHKGRQREIWDGLDWRNSWVITNDLPFSSYWRVLNPYEGTFHSVRPIHQPGDFLWVKETWAPRADNPALTHYRASPPPAPPSKWRPAIHMPRQRSRISLEVNRAAVQWLWEISEEDALAEGVERLPSGLYRNYLADMHFEFARTSFASLWDAVNAPRGLGWQTNRPVWALSFSLAVGPVR